ncbi:hypothetical protein EBF04_23730 [Streptomyces sp. I6]|nr:hypothetical protein EBF04_23730 [Streptomyces sp. I6]
MPSGEADADRYSPLPSDGARSKTALGSSLSRVETSWARTRRERAREHLDTVRRRPDAVAGVLRKRPDPNRHAANTLDTKGNLPPY